MLLSISDILEQDTLEWINKRIAKLAWHDGRKTAGASARAVKRNLQADLNSEIGRALDKKILATLKSHPVLLAAARPKLFSNLLVSKTSENDYYGPHIDNALMKKGDQQFRSDLSFTLFLTPPAEYEGGELVIHTAGVDQAVKGDAGDLMLYPSTSIHEVAPITRGERIVCVGWIESLIADPSRRETLFDLENLRVSLRKAYAPNSPELLTLNKTIANLLRAWAQP
ncbi:MAG: Fe2+-dependent dioxygenase [Pseudomonadota bacterium]